MNTHTNEVYRIPPNQIKSFLTINEWSLRNENERWLVFTSGHAIDIILAKDVLAPDYHVYVDHMLRTLSSATGRTAETIANDIIRFDRDLLTIEVDSRSIDNAAMQMPPIKRLIGHSANMERSLKPYFNQYYLEARKMLKHFEIHQTCNGNVSYHVESQVGELEPYQTLLFDDQEDPGNKFPLQRRVMERIATGLIDLEDSVRNQDPHALIAGYADGFNANMCYAILEISKHSVRPVQYSVNWSKKLPVSQGLRDVKDIPIRRPHIEYLRRACEKLKQRKSEFQRIEGRVIGLSSSGDPQSDDIDNSERSIVVLRTDRNGSSRKLWLNLGKDDYITAHRAHLDWATISVEGIAINRRAGWQLADPQEFKILR